MVRTSSFLGLLLAFLAVGCSDESESSNDAPDASTHEMLDGGLDAAQEGGSEAGADTGTDTAGDTGPAPIPGTDCAALGLTARSFDTSGDATNGEYDEVVGDLALDTLSGPFRLSDGWTGCDSHVFVLRNAQLWQSEVRELIDDSPPNAHYFFVSMRNADQEAESTADVTELKVRFDEYLSTVDEELGDAWGRRLHFVTTPGKAAGWLGELSQQYNNSIHMIGIDRFQRARDGGYPGRVVGSSWVEQVGHARYLAYAYNYESDLTERLESEGDAMVVNVAERRDLQDEVITVELGAFEQLADYDKLEIDLRADCPGEEGHPVSRRCGEWDTGGYVRVCEDQACSDGGLVVHKWITPYANEGWWVSDISEMLPYFSRGGPVYLRIHSGYAYKYTINLRFRDTDTAPPPRSAARLYGKASARFDATYNEEFRPVTFTPPPGTTRVLFHGLISGHGMSTGANCAEFCTHQHQLRVNGTEFETEYEMETGTGANYGCARRVREGVTPNQGGTWIYDRAAWCPGWPVAPWVVDITDAVNLDGENLIRWTSSYRDGNPPGNGGVIDGDLYLVFHGPGALAEAEIHEVPAEPACLSPLTVTVRDFLTTHPDFALDNLPDQAKGVKLGAVEDRLVDVGGGQWKPVYAWEGNSAYGMNGPTYVPFTTGDNFATWFTDVPGVNYTASIPMEWTKSYANTALFDHWWWYPLDPQFGWGAEGNPNNKDYTLEVVSSFTYVGGETLRFSAESDLWVFLNHQLAVDLGGGIHGYLDRVVDVDAMANELDLVVGETYDIHIFAADRNHTPRFTLEMPDNCP